MRIFPPAASSIASSVDLLVLFLLGASALIALTIFIAQLIFAIRYRRRPGNELAQRVTGTTGLEIAWTVAAVALALVPFIWGANLYLAEARPPNDALDVYIVARQWMWKAQHSAGQTEIDELHVPVGRPVKLTMTSQDVIHSFFVPDFRIKQDVLPNRYTTMWFEATQPGTYRLFCAEYCGLDHSRMRGQIVAMPPAAFAEWLRSGSALAPAGAGRKLFAQFGCIACHETGRAPNLAGIFGRTIVLQGGQTVIADENYLRESIVKPSAKVVQGYEPIMPSFSGRLTEEQLLQLIEYIKSLGMTPGVEPGRPEPPPIPTPPGARQP